jgi:'Cold-shock' DNA-binding domain
VAKGPVWVMPVGSCLIDGEAMLPRTARVCNSLMPNSQQAVVKWYSVEKAFGFALPDDHSADLFIHRTIVAGRRCIPFKRHCTSPQAISLRNKLTAASRASRSAEAASA